MKVKLWNGNVTAFALNVLGGGYDVESQRVQLIVRGGDEASAGTIQMDPSEALRIAALITANTPRPTRVEAVEDPVVEPARALRGAA